jgi:hypothetical protein
MKQSVLTADGSVFDENPATQRFAPTDAELAVLRKEAIEAPSETSAFERSADPFVAAAPVAATHGAAAGAATHLVARTWARK